MADNVRDFDLIDVRLGFLLADSVGHEVAQGDSLRPRSNWRTNCAVSGNNNNTTTILSHKLLLTSKLQIRAVHSRMATNNAHFRNDIQQAIRAAQAGTRDRNLRISTKSGTDRKQGGRVQLSLQPNSTCPATCR